MPRKKRKGELKSQADVRRYLRWKDQHGRWWGSSVEDATLNPCGPISPLFTAPIYPPPDVIVIPEEDLGYLTIDYDLWTEKLREFRREWDERLRLFCFEKYGQKAGEAIQDPPPEALAYIGQPPLSVDVPRACKSGNKWILGLPQPDGSAYPRPSWAEGLLPEPPVALSVDEEIEELQEEFPDATPGDFELPQMPEPQQIRPGVWQLFDESVIGEDGALKKPEAVAISEERWKAFLENELGVAPA